jgi:hypothetical protein
MDDVSAQQSAIDDREPQQSMMVAVSNALVALHKEQFGRGPTKARSPFARPAAPPEQSKGELPHEAI